MTPDGEDRAMRLLKQAAPLLRGGETIASLELADEIDAFLNPKPVKLTQQEVDYFWNPDGDGDL